MLRDILRTLLTAREASARHNDDLAAKHRVSGAVPPLNALNMLSKHNTWCAELLSYYIDVWEAARLSIEPGRVSEQSERVLQTTQAAFIAGVSALEACSKAALTASPHILPPAKNGRTTLSNIMLRSETVGLLSSERSREWIGILELRHALVHNNGVSERTVSYQLSPRIELVFVEGEMTRGPLSIFAECGSWLVDAFAEWSDAWLTARRGS